MLHFCIMDPDSGFKPVEIPPDQAMPRQSATHAHRADRARARARGHELPEQDQEFPKGLRATQPLNVSAA